MPYIILDIECNFSKWNPDFETEIIQIGMVKVDSSDLGKREYFSSFVKPKNAIEKRVTKLTGITNEDVKNAPTFEEIYPEIIEFIGEDYCFVTWGNEDIRFLSISCENDSIPMISIPNQINLQRLLQFGLNDIFKKQTISLSHALELLHLEAIGTQHSAIDDAMNTCTIFEHVYPLLDVHADIEELKINSESYVNQNNKLTAKGNRLLKSLLVTYMETNSVINVTEDEFFSHPYWLDCAESNNIDESLFPVFYKNFPRIRGEVKKLFSMTLKKEPA